MPARCRSAACGALCPLSAGSERPIRPLRPTSTRPANTSSSQPREDGLPVLPRLAACLTTSLGVESGDEEKSKILSVPHAAAAPGMMKIGRDNTGRRKTSSVLVEGRLPVELRARLSVWPGCRHEPVIVAPGGRGAREADCCLFRYPRVTGQLGGYIVDIIYRVWQDWTCTRKRSSRRCAACGPAGNCKRSLRTFGTMTGDLMELAGLAGVPQRDARRHGSHGSPMETGVEHPGRPFRVVAGQSAGTEADSRPQERRQGRQWIAQLLQHGLLRSSFVPRGRSASCGT